MQLYLGILVSVSYCYCGDNIRTFFKTLAAKKATSWLLKKPQSN